MHCNLQVLLAFTCKVFHICRYNNADSQFLTVSLRSSSIVDGEYLRFVICFTFCSPCMLL